MRGGGGGGSGSRQGSAGGRQPRPPAQPSPAARASCAKGPLALPPPPMRFCPPSPGPRSSGGGGLLPAARRGERVEGGEREHLRPIRHLPWARARGAAETELAQDRARRGAAGGRAGGQAGGGESLRLRSGPAGSCGHGSKARGRGRWRRASLCPAADGSQESDGQPMMPTGPSLGCWRRGGGRSEAPQRPRPACDTDAAAQKWRGGGAPRSRLPPVPTGGSRRGAVCPVPERSRRGERSNAGSPALRSPAGAVPGAEAPRGGSCPAPGAEAAARARGWRRLGGRGGGFSPGERQEGCGAADRNVHGQQRGGRAAHRGRKGRGHPHRGHLWPASMLCACARFRPAV